MILDKRGLSNLSKGVGKEMNTQLLVIEKGCTSRLEEYLDKFGVEGKVVAVYDTNTYSAKGQKRVKADYEVVMNADGLHANEKAIAYLEKLSCPASVAVAVGSGTLHDIVRYYAARRGMVFVSCPTAASVDGYTSNVSSLTIDGGKKTVSAVAPLIVLADLDVIKNAPMRLTKSGIGDMMGKYVSLCDWKIGQILTGEFYDEQIVGLMYEAVALVEKNAPMVLQGSDKAYESLIYGLLLSGIAMQLTGNSRAASGAEHHISHLLEIASDYFGVARDTYHGERVGVGTLLISESYHRIVEEDFSKAFHIYSAPKKEALVQCFGEAAATIQEENTEDCLVTVKEKDIAAHWDEIRQVVAAIPTVEQLKKLYSKLGLMSALVDLGVDEEKKGDILKLSPFCRNRLTLQRMAVEYDL